MSLKRILPLVSLKRILPLVSLVCCSQAFAQQPSAQNIVNNARINTTLQKTDLKGNISQNGARTPVFLFLRGKEIQFSFQSENTTNRFHLRLDDDQYSLFDITADGKTRAFPKGKLTESIAKSDLTYEDLALRFFYWPNPILERTESVGGQDCYLIRLNKPAGDAGRYYTVYVWIHTKFGAFMRVRGFDKAGKILKEFEVQDIMKVSKDTWTIRKMQVSTFSPTDGKRISISDLIFDKPSASSPKALQ